MEASLEKAAVWGSGVCNDLIACLRYKQFAVRCVFRQTYENQKEPGRGVNSHLPSEPHPTYRNPISSAHLTKKDSSLSRAVTPDDLMF